MPVITATDLALRTDEILDTLAQGQSFTINHNGIMLIIGTINPPQRAITVREALTQMPKLSAEEARSFRKDIRGTDFSDEVCDPRDR